MVLFLGKNTCFVGEPIVCVDDIGLKLPEILLDKITVRALNVADREILGFVASRNDGV